MEPMSCAQFTAIANLLNAFYSSVCIFVCIVSLALIIEAIITARQWSIL